MIKTMLQRLLSHLHRAVFDTSADEVVAFYLDGPAGSSWVAANEFFDITFADGSTIHYDLNNFTISQFIARLRADGMIVLNVNQDTLLFSGITMLELSGAAGKQNPITLYRDILHAIFGAYSREMNAARDNVGEGLKQLNINTATNGFLDVWGKLFGVPRSGLPDPDYQKKIPKEAFRHRINTIAIQQAVKDQTGFDITLKELWRDVFRVDISRLSGPDKFELILDPSDPRLDPTSPLYDPTKQAGNYIVLPTAASSVDWNKILPIIQRNIAAGVTVLKPINLYVFFVNDPINGSVWFQQWGMYGFFIKSDSMPRLDMGLVLSGANTNQMNFGVMITSSQLIGALGNNVLGKVNYMPSIMRSYFASLGNVPIGTSYTADYKGAVIQLYPTDPRTWMTGKWDDNATWVKPYEWSVLMRPTAVEDTFTVNYTDPNNWLGVGVVSSVTSSTTTGDTWEDQQEWSDDQWDHNADPNQP